MSCINPNYLEAFTDDCTGLITYKFMGNARHSNPLSFGRFSDLADGKKFCVTIPCRHCLGCAIDYSREWANRLCLELLDSKKAVFVTMTYNNESVPKTDKGVLTLCVRDTQLFFKRLRKYFENVTIRYYLAGEYGGKTHRPHYHAIIFGISPLDFPDLKLFTMNELGNGIYTSKIFEDIWNNGFCSLAEVNFKTCAYVSRYVLKKHYGFNKHELNGALPEFNNSSRRPGIGLKSYRDVLSKDCDLITLNTGDDVHTFSIPKAILKKGLQDENFVDFCRQYCYNKLDKSNDRLISDLLWTEKSYDQYLRDNFKELYSRIKLLKERS